MLNNILDVVPGDGSSWAGQTQSPNNYYLDNFGMAFMYAAIGFAVVFVGIVIIIAVIWLVGLIMRKTNNFAFIQKKNKPVKTTEAVASAQGMVDDGEVPDEVKAAIVAAIMAYYSEKQEKCQFTVKRIKRI